MGKKQSKQRLSTKEQEKYPSAELLQTACYEDYMRLLNTYDKIYDKVNVALTFCGVVLVLVLNSFDFTLFMKLPLIDDNGYFFLLILHLVAMTMGAVCIVKAALSLVLLLKSKELQVFDSVGIRNSKIYESTPNEAALWLIDRYTTVTNALRQPILEKQKKLNSCIVTIAISVIMYTITLITSKGL